MRLRRPAGAIVLLLTCALAWQSGGSPPVAASSPGIAASGPFLVSATGEALRLAGVNRSGTEYACVQGHGIFDGPSDAASIAAMAAWHVNSVRVPLNEDCWLGINGVPAAYSGVAYQAAIAQYVELLHQQGLFVILDLHWAAPGTVPATRQLVMADADHAPSFWSSVATTFKADPAVIFDLYNEPTIDTGDAQTSDPWTCWRDGCAIDPGDGVAYAWHSAGMQQLVDAVRATGARQLVMAGGLAHANDLSGWLAHRPSDPAGQLAASLHVYNFNACSAASCWTAQVAPVARQVPVITGELGEDDCAGGFIDGYMGWADLTGVSYAGWTWDTWDCRSGPALISDYSGTPTAFGAAYRDHLASPQISLWSTVRRAR